MRTKSLLWRDPNVVDLVSVLDKENCLYDVRVYTCSFVLYLVDLLCYIGGTYVLLVV